MNKIQNNRGLGRGLSALIGGDDNLFESTVKRSDANKNSLRIDDIIPSSDQPRKIFDQEHLQDLADSIKQNGVLQPIIVREDKENHGKYQIIAGERRWRASKLAGQELIPVIIKDISNVEKFEISIIENIQRQDLTVIEEAEAYKQLISEYNYSQEMVASKVGKSRSHVTNIMRILSLPQEVKDYVNIGALTMGHARALVGVDGAAAIAKQIIEQNLSVRDTEKLIRSLEVGEHAEKHRKDIINKKLRRNNTKSSENDEDLLIIEKHLSEKLGLEVKINDGQNGGNLIIYFNNIEQLDNILKKLSLD